MLKFHSATQLGCNQVLQMCFETTYLTKKSVEVLTLLKLQYALHSKLFLSLTVKKHFRMIVSIYSVYIIFQHIYIC